MKLSFLIFIIPFLAMIAGASLFIFRTGVAFDIIRSPLTRQVVTWIFIIIPALLIITMALSNMFYSAITNFFYVIAATWLPILIYLSMASILLLLIKLIAVAFGAYPSINMFPIAVATIVIALGATLFGIINATVPRIVSYQLDVPELSKLWSGKNIVLVSDTHLGTVRGKGFMEKVVRNINAQNPDLVLIAGDIIDGPVFNYEKGLSPLSKIVSTYGTVYTPGNHEGYNREPEKFYPVVRNLTTTLLDSKIEINDTMIVGLDYRSEKLTATQERLLKTGFLAKQDDGTPMPSIAVLHDPTNTDALLDAGVSLVVSGHTHCGQFFPINLIVKNIYKQHTYGVVDRKESVGTDGKPGSGVSLTTCGVGTALSPLRLGTNPEIVVIHIK
jgi:predicted MPP superfamily phosphohydrolase